MDSDVLLLKRLQKFVRDFRDKNARFPTLQDLEKAQYPKALVSKAVKKGLLTEWYVPMTNGALVKGFKAAD